MTTKSNKRLPDLSDNILKIYNASDQNQITYHNYKHTHDVVSVVNSICENGNTSDKEYQIAYLAAWFVDVGYLKDYDHPEVSSRIMCEEVLASKRIARTTIKQACQCLFEVLVNDPVTASAKILNDAILIVNFGLNFKTSTTLLKAETEAQTGKSMDRIEWAERELDRMRKANYLTHYGKLHGEDTLSELIQNHVASIDKWKAQAFLPADSIIDFSKKFGVEEGIPERAIQTFFRANYRNHINLSAIADNKANIMISVNAIILSLLISILTYKDYPNQNPVVLFPIVIFIVTGLTSLTFAVLSARPKVTAFFKEGVDMDKAKRNITFFGNFVSLNLDQYEEVMDEVFQSSELIYGNMVRDLYYLGKVLDKKYHYLRYSYSIFMLGFVATVLTFMIVFFS